MKNIALHANLGHQFNQTKNRKATFFVFGTM